MSQLGSAIASGVAASDVRIPLDQALYIQCYARLGKAGYTALRLSLLPYGVVFPPYNEIADYKYQNIVPTKLVFIAFKSNIFLSFLCHRRNIKTRMAL